MSAAKKILCVEDDHSMQLLLRSILQRAGYAVEIAEDAVQAVMLARTAVPDLIILDIMIPAGGGQSVLERVRNLTATRHVPVLIFSATPKEIFDGGAPLGEGVTFLQKPAQKDGILAEVRRLLDDPPGAPDAR